MKTALVTGGTGDIGRAIIRRLVESGYRVIFTYEKNERMARSLYATSRMTGAWKTSSGYSAKRESL